MVKFNCDSLCLYPTNFAEKTLIFGKLVMFYSFHRTPITMTHVQLQQLQKQLWNIANTLRGTMGADEFRDYILGFIFFTLYTTKIDNSLK